MSYTVKWLVDKRILHVAYEGDLNQAELAEINEAFGKYLSEGIAPIHIISDNSNTGKISLNIKTVRNSFAVLKDNRWGTVCVIGANAIAKFFAKIVSNSFRLNVKMVDNLDEAQEILAKIDNTLPKM